MTDRLTQLEKLIAADPNDTFCLYGLAMEHAKQGATDKAVALYDRALQVDPGMCYAYFHKAKALEAADRLDSARQTLRDGLATAKRVGDAKAANEIAGFLDEIT
jgi:Tfp pilus assembly protein PilF